MDYATLTIEEIKNGYRYDEVEKAYVCNYCGRRFDEGQVFPMGDRFYVPEYAAREHIAAEHDGALKKLIEGGAKYNTFTDTQKELLGLFAQGLSDNEIAAKLGVKASTVRHQKFTFREKAKQAKYYLAVYDEVFGEGGARKADDIVDIPNTATMLDDRYVITEKERERILRSEFESMNPLRLRHYPLKAKKQVVVLSEVAKLFEFGRTYTEAETREMLGAVYGDYSMLRRYLVDYGFMGRTKDGSEYWLK
ncbi:DUF2087 domain-containing protein [Raoultibacter phocaeensis]|uniref:DUF2087 domain-containing protein n=1 Tax=Raoultibacter phocaeensis TaxID=2479841 RepID=UPI001119A874|nr:DUF2087 domain-containing protein [Raoultibacter phocaeensis]